MVRGFRYVRRLKCDYKGGSSSIDLTLCAEGISKSFFENQEGAIQIEGKSTIVEVINSTNFEFDDVALPWRIALFIIRIVNNTRRYYK